MTLAAKAPAIGSYINEGARMMLAVMDLYEKAVGHPDAGGCRVIAMAYSDWLQNSERRAKAIHFGDHATAAECGDTSLDALFRRLMTCAETLASMDGRSLFPERPAEDW